MKKLGLILACDHYPAVSHSVTDLDAQFRHWLLSLGLNASRVGVFSAYEGELPEHADEADVWIVSGMPLPLAAGGTEAEFELQRFLQTSASIGQPILSVNHGEHVLHDALAAVDAPRPRTSPHIRSIRNPFRSFLGRDTLHRFNAMTRRVEELARPEVLCPRALFGSLRRAA